MSETHTYFIVQWRCVSDKANGPWTDCGACIRYYDAIFRLETMRAGFNGERTDMAGMIAAAWNRQLRMDGIRSELRIVKRIVTTTDEVMETEELEFSGVQHEKRKHTHE